MDADDMSVAIGPKPSKPLTEAKKQQLANARKLAMESRRRAQKQRLEIKLAELRSTLAGASDDHVARFVGKMMEQEQELREKSTLQITQINENLTIFNKSLTRIDDTLHAMGKVLATKRHY